MTPKHIILIIALVLLNSCVSVEDKKFHKAEKTTDVQVPNAAETRINNNDFTTGISGKNIFQEEPALNENDNSVSGSDADKNDNSFKNESSSIKSGTEVLEQESEHNKDSTVEDGKITEDPGDVDSDFNDFLFSKMFLASVFQYQEKRQTIIGAMNKNQLIDSQYSVIYSGADALIGELIASEIQNENLQNKLGNMFDELIHKELLLPEIELDADDNVNKKDGPGDTEYLIDEIILKEKK